MGFYVKPNHSPSSLIIDYKLYNLLSCPPCIHSVGRSGEAVRTSDSIASIGLSRFESPCCSPPDLPVVRGEVGHGYHRLFLHLYTFLLLLSFQISIPGQVRLPHVAPVHPVESN